MLKRYTHTLYWMVTENVASLHLPLVFIGFYQFSMLLPANILLQDTHTHTYTELMLQMTSFPFLFASFVFVESLFCWFFFYLRNFIYFRFLKSDGGLCVLFFLKRNFRWKWFFFSEDNEKKWPWPKFGNRQFYIFDLNVCHVYLAFHFLHEWVANVLLLFLSLEKKQRKTHHCLLFSLSFILHNIYKRFKW